MIRKQRFTEKQYQAEWANFRDNILKAAPIELNENFADKKARIKRLEAHPEDWFQYYFPNFCFAEPAKFHKRATKRLLKKMEWYEVRAWSRELAKSTRSMMEILYLCLSGKKKNVLLVSSSYGNAERLLLPFKGSLELNPRIINDYGIQEKLGSWEAGEFITRKNVAFRAIGAGQNPRGTKNDEIRPDLILIDDIDTDEDCRNPEIVTKKWRWLEKALLATRSISRPLTVLFNGNIIAPFCCVTEAIKHADHTDVINIRDKKGISSWLEKNTEAMIDRVLSKISYAAQQQEYFNNPVREGTVFKEMAFKHAMPLRAYTYLVCYTDPSFKDSKKNDFKATVLVGKWRDEFHVIKCFLQQTTTAKMIDWHYQMMELVGDRPCYYYMEEVFLQDLIIHEFYRVAETREKTIPIMGDKRSKSDKFTRIESLLEPLHRNGKLYLNEREKDNPSMLSLKDQFEALGPGSRAHDDGPDAVEGAVWQINNKSAIADTGNIMIIKRKPSKKRY